VILIAYDGSDDARHAVEHAAQLWPGKQATVLSVWEPFAEVISHASTGFVAGMADYDEIDAASEKLAGDRSREGAELATTKGLDATPRERAQATTSAPTRPRSAPRRSWSDPAGWVTSSRCCSAASHTPSFTTRPSRC
jgi:hypothetical protein